MASLSMTNFEYALKELYPKEKVEFLAHKNSQFLMRVKKNPNMTGELFKQPVQYGHGAGISKTFSTAQSLRSEVLGVAFLITQANYHSVASIDNKVVLNSRGNEGAILNALKSEMDGAITNISRSLAVDIIRTPTGNIGVSSGIASSTITLVTRSDINNFHKGMTIMTAASASASLDNATGDVISSVDRDAGTFDVASTNNTYTSGRLIFVKGDYVSSSDVLAMSGLQSWITSAAPGALFGVTRTVDSTRLSGVKLNGATGRTDELLFQCVTRVAEEGGSPDLALVSFGRWNVLQQELAGKVQYTKREFGDSKVGTVGFSSLVIPGPAGDVEIIPDRFVPDTSAFVLSSDTWTLHSAGPAPHIDDLDGRSVLRESAAAALEVRVEAYVNLGCSAPGYNGVIHTMPAL